MRPCLAAAVLALSTSGFAADAGVYRIFLLQEAASSDRYGYLQGRLNRDIPDKPFVVLNHLPSWDSRIIADALPLALDRYAPNLVIAVVSREGSASARSLRLAEAIRARGVPFLLMSSPGLEAKNSPPAGPGGRVGARGDDMGSFEGRIPEIRKILGAASAPGGASRERAEAAFRLVAQAHRDLDDPAGARTSLVDLLALRPDDLEALTMLVGISRDDDQPWEALAYADRIAAVPGASTSQRAEADRQAGEIRLRLGDSPGAELSLKRALELRPGDPRILYLLAAAERGRPEEALAVVDRAASAAGATARERAKVELLAGELRMDLGDKAGAEQSIRRALSLAPDDLDALYALVRILRSRKEEALVFAERAARAAAQAPPWRRPAAYRLSARVWLELEEPARAAQSLRRALELNAEDLDALGALVAIKDRLAPKDLAAFRLAALPVRIEAEERPSSEAGPLRALEADPGDLEALRALIAIKRDHLQLPEAAAYAERFMRSAGETPVWQQAEAYRVLAALWLDLGNANKAVQSLRRAENLQQDSLATHQRLFELRPGELADSFPTEAAFIHCAAAEMRIELQDPAGAEELLKRALELRPNHSWALRLMSSLKRPAPGNAAARVRAPGAKPPLASPGTRARQRNAEVRRLNDEGVESFLRGDSEKALRLFRTALEAAPKDVETLANIALTYDSIGDPPKALAGYGEAISLAGSSSAHERETAAALLASRADLLAWLGRSDEAREDLVKALALAPGEWPKKASIENQLKSLRGSGKTD
ncbi:MAG: tetratricopeptide repeat protein [Elusimicrobia bacterium]|nr:tetratricopeptide repeat protein [Elusimicrobiota bacterium]